jgi:hypothetical protein
MRFQLRLLDGNLAGFNRHLSRRCWMSVAALVPEGSRWRACRSVFRHVKSVLQNRIEAREYCGNAFPCDAFLNPVEEGQAFRKSVPPAEAERTGHYLLAPGTTPGQLVAELSRECLKVLADASPRAGIRGTGRGVRMEIRAALKPLVYRNDSCGTNPLCRVNNPVDAWTRKVSG